MRGGVMWALAAVLAPCLPVGWAATTFAPRPPKDDQEQCADGATLDEKEHEQASLRGSALLQQQAQRGRTFTGTGEDSQELAAIQGNLASSGLLNTLMEEVRHAVREEVGHVRDAVHHDVDQVRAEVLRQVHHDVDQVRDEVHHDVDHVRGEVRQLRHEESEAKLEATTQAVQAESFQPPEAGQDDPVPQELQEAVEPSSTKRVMKGKSTHGYFEACHARKPRQGAVQQETRVSTQLSASTATRIKSALTTPPCTGSTLPLWSFTTAETPFSTCCPQEERTCAGCEMYDAASSRCTKCRGGFTEIGGFCTACVDIAGWQDGMGATCRSASCTTVTNKGVSSNQACCRCGGGHQSATPFAYDHTQVAIGTSVEVLPLPRTASRFSVDDKCELGRYSLTLDGATGKVSGVATGEGTAVCQVTAHQSNTLTFTAKLEITIGYIGYPSPVLLFTPGRTEYKSVGTLDSFSMQCAPDATGWLTITDDGTLRMTASPQAAGAVTDVQDKYYGQDGAVCMVSASKPDKSRVTTKVVALVPKPWQSLPYEGNKVGLNFAGRGPAGPAGPAVPCVSSPSTVVYNGYMYRTLTGLLKYSVEPIQCESSWNALPSGYELVEFNQDIYDNVVVNRPWSTHGMVFGQSGTWHTGGSVWNGQNVPWKMKMSGGKYSTPTCSLAALVRRPCSQASSQAPTGNPQAPMPVPVPGNGWCADAAGRQPAAHKYLLGDCSQARQECSNDASCVAYACTTRNTNQVLYTSTGCTDRCSQRAWLADPNLIVKAVSEGVSHYADFVCYVFMTQASASHIVVSLGDQAPLLKVGPLTDLHEGSMAPLTFIPSCTTDEHSLAFEFNTQLNIGLLNDHPIFEVLADGSISVAPATSLSIFFDSVEQPQAGLKQIVLKCRVHALFADSSLQPVSAPLRIDIWDNVCWAFQTFNARAKPDASITSESLCRNACRQDATCSHFGFGIQGGSCSFYERSAAGPQLTVLAKISNCAVSDACLSVTVPIMKLYSGIYCPVGQELKRGTIYLKEGATKEETVYLVKYLQADGCHTLPNDNACNCSSNPYVVRRAAPDLDYINADKGVFELKGTALACLPAQIVSDAFGGGHSSSSFPTAALYTKTCPAPNVTLQASDDEGPQVVQPLVVDDPGTAEVADFWLHPCACVPQAWGSASPVDAQAFSKIPPPTSSHPFNNFIPAPFTIVEGQFTCEVGDGGANVLSTHVETETAALSEDDCETRCKGNGGCHFYWHGEQSETVTCRLYKACSKLVREADMTGKLVAVPQQEMCQVANPDACWSTTLRRGSLMQAVLAWHPILRYGTLAYTPTSAAVNADSLGTDVGFAKLADTAINGITDGSSYGKYKLTTTGSNTNNVIYVLTNQPFSDTSRSFGWGNNYYICINPTLSDASDCRWLPPQGHPGFDTISVTGNNVYRWFSDHFGDIHCFPTHSYSTRCFADGLLRMRQNVVILKYGAAEVRYVYYHLHVQCDHALLLGGVGVEHCNRPTYASPGSHSWQNKRPLPHIFESGAALQVSCWAERFAKVGPGATENLRCVDGQWMGLSTGKPGLFGFQCGPCVVVTKPGHAKYMSDNEQELFWHARFRSRLRPELGFPHCLFLNNHQVQMKRRGSYSICDEDVMLKLVPGTAMENRQVKFVQDQKCAQLLEVVAGTEEVISVQAAACSELDKAQLVRTHALPSILWHLRTDERAPQVDQGWRDSVSKLSEVTGWVKCMDGVAALNTVTFLGTGLGKRKCHFAPIVSQQGQVAAPWHGTVILTIEPCKHLNPSIVANSWDNQFSLRATVTGWQGQSATNSLPGPYWGDVATLSVQYSGFLAKDLSVESNLGITGQHCLLMPAKCGISTDDGEHATGVIKTLTIFDYDYIYVNSDTIQPNGCFDPGANYFHGPHMNEFHRIEYQLTWQYVQWIHELATMSLHCPPLSALVELRMGTSGIGYTCAVVSGMGVCITKWTSQFDFILGVDVLASLKMECGAEELLGGFGFDVSRGGKWIRSEYTCCKLDSVPTALTPQRPDPAAGASFEGLYCPFEKDPESGRLRYQKKFSSEQLTFDAANRKWCLSGEGCVADSSVVPFGIEANTFEVSPVTDFNGQFLGRPVDGDKGDIKAALESIKKPPPPKLPKAPRLLTFDPTPPQYAKECSFEMLNKPSNSEPLWEAVKDAVDPEGTGDGQLEWTDGAGELPESHPCAVAMKQGGKFDNVWGDLGGDGGTHDHLDYNALDSCSTREIKRGLKEAHLEHWFELAHNSNALYHAWSAVVCNTIPDPVLTVLGVGTKLNIKDMCGDAMAAVQESIDFGLSTAKNGMSLDIATRDADDCLSLEVDFARLFCDVHCVRDAVVRGDLNIRRNLNRATDITNQNMESFAKWGVDAMDVKTNHLADLMDYLDKKLVTGFAAIDTKLGAVAKKVGVQFVQELPARLRSMLQEVEGFAWAATANKASRHSALTALERFVSEVPAQAAANETELAAFLQQLTALHASLGTSGRDAGWTVHAMSRRLTAGIKHLQKTAKMQLETIGIYHHHSSNSKQLVRKHKKPTARSSSAAVLVELDRIWWRLRGKLDQYLAVAEHQVKTFEAGANALGDYRDCFTDFSELQAAFRRSVDVRKSAHRQLRATWRECSGLIGELAATIVDGDAMKTFVEEEGCNSTLADQTLRQTNFAVGGMKMLVHRFRVGGLGTPDIQPLEDAVERIWGSFEEARGSCST